MTDFSELFAELFAIVGAARLPEKGKPQDEIMRLMQEARAMDVDWRGGKVAAYVFYAGEDILQLSKQAFMEFFCENALDPTAFPSLGRFEAEVVGMVGKLLHCESAAGNVSSGGTESILLAVKTARDLARAARPDLKEPEIVMPVTAHAAYNKAAYYFDLKPVRTPLGDDLRPDIAALRAAVTDKTALMVGSAPEYSYGMIDPIAEMAAIAQERDICFHVDCCMGGFVLPFMDKLGYPVPPFDFSVPGVTSISADIHKYGFAAKGASAILYRDPNFFLQQITHFDGWPSGFYLSPTTAGTRPGGPLAAAWAVLNYLGEEGYIKLVERIMRTTRALQDGINSIPGLEIVGKPDMSLFSYTSRTLDIYAIADEMESRGWWVSRLAEPHAIHLTVTPAHEASPQDYLNDLADATRLAAEGKLTRQASRGRWYS